MPFYSFTNDKNESRAEGFFSSAKEALDYRDKNYPGLSVFVEVFEKKEDKDAKV